MITRERRPPEWCRSVGLVYFFAFPEFGLAARNLALNALSAGDGGSFVTGSTPGDRLLTKLAGNEAVFFVSTGFRDGHATSVSQISGWQRR